MFGDKIDINICDGLLELFKKVYLPFKFPTR